MKVISYGGGVQSTAMIVLATQGKIADVSAALFSNVGDDSELPDTIKYVREVITPWAAERGLPVHELHRTITTTGERETLWQRMMNYDGEALREPIPVFGSNGAPMSRSCTRDHKIRILGRWIREHVPDEELPCDVLIGISMDEIERAGRGSDEKWERRCYPLLDLRLTRAHCIEIIKAAGLPVPPKSSCFFCPFHSTDTWAELRRDRPELFEKAAFLEDTLNERRAAREMPPVYLTRRGKPIRLAIQEASPSLFGDGAFNDGGCDEGYCWV